MSGRQKLLSLELPKVARQANLCVDFAGFCGVWADSGHGYAAAPTVALPSSQGFVALPRHLAIESQPEAAKSSRGEGESRHASKARVGYVLCTTRLCFRLPATFRCPALRLSCGTTCRCVLMPFTRSTKTAYPSASGDAKCRSREASSC